jgi:hypothetical protein
MPVLKDIPTHDYVKQVIAQKNVKISAISSGIKNSLRASGLQKSYFTEDPRQEVAP